MTTDEPRNQEDWYLFAGTGAYRFMVELHERGVPPEVAGEMMRNFGRVFVEESDEPPPEGPGELFPV